MMDQVSERFMYSKNETNGVDFTLRPACLPGGSTQTTSRKTAIFQYHTCTRMQSGPTVGVHNFCLRLVSLDYGSLSMTNTCAFICGLRISCIKECTPTIQRCTRRNSSRQHIPIPTPPEGREKKKQFTFFLFLLPLLGILGYSC